MNFRLVFGSAWNRSSNTLKGNSFPKWSEREGGFEFAYIRHSRKHIHNFRYFPSFFKGTPEWALKCYVSNEDNLFRSTDHKSLQLEILAENDNIHVIITAGWIFSNSDSRQRFKFFAQLL